MSSITIIQEHDQITFAVDTARCHGENGIKYRGYEEKVQKVHRTGLDMVFVAGMTECTDYVKSRLQSFVNKKKHINIELLKQCLKKEFPKEECKWEHLGLYDIGVTILSVSNGESIIYSFSQANNYETFISKAAPKQGIVLVDGFDNDRIHGYASSYIKNLKGFEYRKPETFINIYQNNYSEGVGGFIQVYSMDSDGCRMITEQKLNERNLKYVIGGQVIAPKYFSNTITGYSAHITAASIKGSVIEGSTVKSENEFGNILIDGPFVQGYNAAGERKLYIGYDGSGEFAGNVKCNTLNGYVPVTKGNIGEQYVAHAESSGDANIAMSASYLNMSVTANDAYLTPLSDAYTGCGSSYRRWSAVFAASGTIVTSDQNKKNTIQDPDERYLKLAKMIIPKSFKMNEGTSGRTHLGFIAQEVEAAMTACGISDIEFAGLVKAPIYAKKLTDEDGNELPEYDTASEITGYDYALRYDEFIPLLLARIISQEERIRALEEKAGQ